MSDGKGVVHSNGPGDAASCPGVHSIIQHTEHIVRCPSEHGESEGLFNRLSTRIRTAIRARHSPDSPYFRRANHQGGAPSTSLSAVNIIAEHPPMAEALGARAIGEPELT